MPSGRRSGILTNRKLVSGMPFESTRPEGGRRDKMCTGQNVPGTRRIPGRDLERRPLLWGLGTPEVSGLSIVPATTIEKGCPFDCGLCPDTDSRPAQPCWKSPQRCDLRCSYCFADSERQFVRILI